MKNCIGIVKSPDLLANNYSILTKNRPDYMLPYGGRYRVVDFTLSNLSEHGIEKVLVYAGLNIRSTLDHIASGKNWGLDRRVDGLMINPPGYDRFGNTESQLMTLYNSLRFFKDARQEYVYLTNPMVITRIDITKAYKEFIDNDYDVMFLYRSQKDLEGDFINARNLIMDEDGELKNVGLHLGTEDVFNMFVENMFIKKDVFIDVVTKGIERGNATTLIDAIFSEPNLKLGTLEIFRHVEYIRDLISFYKSNLNLLNYGIYADLMLAGEGIRTKTKDEPSSLYLEDNKASNSIVANGCIINGEVENSVVFRGAKIGKGAIIKNSIIFQKAVIEENAVVINAVVDKNAVIKEGVFVQGSSNNPYVVEKNMVVEK